MAGRAARAGWALLGPKARRPPSGALPDLTPHAPMPAAQAALVLPSSLSDAERAARIDTLLDETLLTPARWVPAGLPHPPRCRRSHMPPPIALC